MANVRNPLSPLIGKVKELEDIGKHLASSTIERGEHAIGSVIELGKGATHFALDTAKKPVDTATDTVELALSLTTTTVTKLGKFAAGLLPALGDRTPGSSKKE